MLDSMTGLDLSNGEKKLLDRVLADPLSRHNQEKGIIAALIVVPIMLVLFYLSETGSINSSIPELLALAGGIYVMAFISIEHRRARTLLRKCHGRILELQNDKDSGEGT